MNDNETHGIADAKSQQHAYQDVSGFQDIIGHVLQEQGDKESDRRRNMEAGGKKNKYKERKQFPCLQIIKDRAEKKSHRHSLSEQVFHVDQIIARKKKERGYQNVVRVPLYCVTKTGQFKKGYERNEKRKAASQQFDHRHQEYKKRLESGLRDHNGQLFREGRRNFFIGVKVMKKVRTLPETQTGTYGEKGKNKIEEYLLASFFRYREENYEKQ